MDSFNFHPSATFPVVGVARGDRGNSPEDGQQRSLTVSSALGGSVVEVVQITVEFAWLVVQVCCATVLAVYRLLVPPPARDVSGDVVLITGAGHGMGREMALRFSALGAVVVCVDINPQGNKETVQAIKEAGGKGHAYHCDVSNKKAVTELAAQVSREIGEVTILVNNAGVMPCHSLLHHTEQQVRAVMDVNVLGNIWMMQAFFPSMLERNHGHIVTMSSLSGLGGQPNVVPYCASKYAVRGLMEALAKELADYKYRDTSGIKLTTVYPYLVNTGLAQRPRVRFTNAMRIMEPGEAAELIVDAVCRGYGEISVPRHMYYQAKIMQLLPASAINHITDFAGVTLEPHD